ncbi:MAG TPA: CsbD family protein [Mycobacterium sp.]|nr:CsbD family protein [Mycobacterium sp.]HUH69940.1 CsbD family protein [Mycobacterium sp.]
MAGIDKARNKTEKVKGKAKEIIGRVTRNPTLKTKGIDQQRRANLKDAGEKVKDVFRPKGPRRPR